MKVDSLKISKVFSSGGDVLYLLPHFQREFTWEEEQRKTLFADVQSIYETYDSEKEPEHFMGSLVVINDGTRNGVIPAFKLVDGQQRLTTISLLLCALYRACKESHPDIAKKIQKLLTNPDESGDYHFKVLPTAKYGDRVAYVAIIKGEEPIPMTESKIPEAFAFLSKELSYKISQQQIDPARYFIALTNCLQVVFIDLDQRERPFEIFESLNAKAKPLSPADLVRNYIAMKLPEAKQEEIFNKYWAKIDDLLQEKRTVGKSRLGEITAFLRHYLAMLSGALPNERHVYERFRDRMEKEFRATDAFVDELATLKKYAENYDRLLRPEGELNKEIREQMMRLTVLEVSTAYPFLMAMYDARDQNKVSDAHFLESLKILENYLVRRYLAGEPTNFLNKMFPTLWTAIDHTQFAPSLRQVLLSKNYPSDNKLKQSIYTLGLYDKGAQGRQKTILVFETINQYLSADSGGYTVLNDSATIEHIMPQTLSETWKRQLGANWEQTYRDYLNTLGNLTLVTQEWNGEKLSNEPFDKKQVLLAKHALRLNNSYFSAPLTRWDENAIRARADYLMKQILEIWPAFGEPQPPPSSAGTNPKAVIILGETFRVSSWRDVAFQTAETVAKFVDDFDSIVAQMPSYFLKEKTRYTHRQLSNGWWLYTNLSGANVKSFCARLVALADIPEEEWQVEEE
jgi:uncharacterized protein with ParB-like and HNH nuclease domain